ncbi:hypothetical protein [Arthrobacter sp. NyZ413]|uniref:hypothetical protein n=1 Tax=Arthrobacter sp. NyZ413 TaxID=3144669 RepID=UPI002BB87253|nr:hypothetical protein [Arthrobacter sp.]
MAAKHVAQSINSEVASHLAESMGAPPMPAPAVVAMSLGSAQTPSWPDGSGKAKHPKEHGTNLGRGGQQAAVTAIHRTSRPQMPHSS